MSRIEDESRAEEPTGRFRDEGEVLHREHIDRSHREPVCLAIQTALASVEDVDPTDLDPLADFVDPDALDQFFAPNAPNLDERYAEFVYADYRVCISGDDEIVIRKR